MNAFTVGALLMMGSMTMTAGATLRPQSHVVRQVEKGSRRELALQKVLRAVTFEDETEWIIHPVWAARERSPIGVTRLSADGRAELYLVSDWLPKGSIPRGSVGQVHSVADLGARSIAAAVGWTDPDGEVHNAVLFLDRVDDKYERRATVDLPGVADVVRGPAGTAIVVTASAHRAGGGPRLTVIAPRGVVGELLPASEHADARDAVRRLPQTSLQHVGGSEYAFYDPLDRTLYRFTAVLAGERVQFRALENLSIDDDPATSSDRLVGVFAHSDGGALVARVGLRANGPRTVITMFSSTGAVEGTWESEAPWNAVLRRPGGVDGVVSRGGVQIESVTFDQR
jgi:hypothetical protein